MTYDLSIQRVSEYIVVKENVNGWYLKWDGDQSIFLRMDESMMGQTCGLCGVFDRDDKNDFESRDGELVNTVSLFANSCDIGVSFARPALILFKVLRAASISPMNE